MSYFARSFIFFLLLVLNAFGHGGGEAQIEIGQDKGVIEVTKDKSFKLSPEATKNFGLQTVPFAAGSITLPKSALAHTLKESQIFRLRNGYLKAVHFKVISKNEKGWTIQSSELQAKDEIITTGVGFLRIIASQLGEDESDEEAHEGSEEHHHD